MDSRDLGWLEGIIDGDGCLSLSKGNLDRIKRGFQWTAKLDIVNTDKQVVEKARDLIGVGAIKLRKPYKKGWKPCYAYTLSSGGLRQLLPALRLTAKERQRIFLLEAVGLLNKRRPAMNDERLEAIYQELRKLNHRGAP